MFLQHTASPLLLAFLLWGLIYRHTPSSRRGLPVLLQFYTWGLISVNKGKALGGRVGAKGRLLKTAKRGGQQKPLSGL